MENNYERNRRSSGERNSDQDNDWHNQNRDWRDHNYDQNSFRDRDRSSESQSNRGYGRNPNSNWDSDQNSDRDYRRESPFSRTYGKEYSDKNWERGHNRDREYDNYGLGDTSQGSGNYGHHDNSNSRHLSHGTGSLGRTHLGSDDQNRGSNRYGDFNSQNQNRDRDWWDRTSDEVSSWFGDSDAERRRERDKMYGPHKGKGPKGYMRSDEKLKDEINDRLYHDSYIDASEIEVKVEDGEVTLSGTVGDRETKRRAEDCAENITGVKDVMNHLRVNREMKDQFKGSMTPKNTTSKSTTSNDKHNDLHQSDGNSRKRAHSNN